jgi:hypothetical protein
MAWQQTNATVATVYSNIESIQERAERSGSCARKRGELIKYQKGVNSFKKQSKKLALGSFNKYALKSVY